MGGGSESEDQSLEGTAPRLEDSPERARSNPGELPGGLACFPLGESFPPHLPA